MRQPEDVRYYKDASEHVHHAVKERAGKHLTEITEGEARRLCAAKRSNVIPMPQQGALRDAEDPDPLPRFLTIEPSVAPEMQDRLADFQRRVQERLEEVSSQIPVSDDPRLAALEKRIDDLGKELRREIAAAMRQIGGGQ